MKKGFTLLELIVVIIIIAILATLGFTQYTRVVEKGRTSEARSILGQIRSAEESYYLEYRTYAALANLYVEAPANCSQTTHYFQYSATGDATGFTATATRCTANGKPPVGPSAYTISVDQTGTWAGTAGYF